MKRILTALVLIALGFVPLMATDIVPNPTTPGNLGTAANGWPSVYATNFIGGGTFLTGIQPTNIASGQTGAGAVYNGGNIFLTNDFGITILYQNDGSVLYSNVVNSVVVGGASSITLRIGQPLNPAYYATNANFVTSGLANYTNGWGGSGAVLFNNTSGSAITDTHTGFTSVMTNGVICTSGVVTLPAGWMFNETYTMTVTNNAQGSGKTNAYGVLHP